MFPGGRTSQLGLSKTIELDPLTILKSLAPWSTRAFTAIPETIILSPSARFGEVRKNESRGHRHDQIFNKRLVNHKDAGSSNQKTRKERTEGLHEQSACPSKQRRLDGVKYSLDDCMRIFSSQSFRKVPKRLWSCEADPHQHCQIRDGESQNFFAANSIPTLF